MAADPLGIVAQQLGVYRVDDFRSSGAFAFVYAATHTPSGATVALKLLNPNAGWPQQREFDNEGNLLLKMSGSSAVVGLLDSDVVTVQVVATAGAASFPVKLRYHVLELADGCLDELIADLSHLDWPSRLALFRDAVLGIHQLHNRHVVHRDLKSPNCLLFREGGEVRVKVGDLGRARDLQQPAGAVPLDYVFGRGDPDFAPPEFLWGLGDDSPDTHRRADLYGLGSLLFELGVGQGITGLAVFPQAQHVLAHHQLAATQRSAAYRARLAEIRGWYEGPFRLFEAAVPKSIRPHASRLVRLLCDPDPRLRVPQVAPGRRSLPTDGLPWLLHRADVLRLTLRNDIRQTERLRSRKGV